MVNRNALKTTLTSLLPLRVILALLLSFAFGSPLVFAQAAGDTSEEGSDAEKLAKQLANPIAALISVPVQFNYDQNIGLADDGSK